MPLHVYFIGNSVEDFIVGWISMHCGWQITAKDFITAGLIYNMFMTETDKRKALNAFETLMSLKAGRGLLQLEIEIAEINGVSDLANDLRKFIADYETRPHRND